jgi:hypothetical protein
MLTSINTTAKPATTSIPSTSITNVGPTIAPFRRGASLYIVSECLVLLMSELIPNIVLGLWICARCLYIVGQSGLQPVVSEDEGH